MARDQSEAGGPSDKAAQPKQISDVRGDTAKVDRPAAARNGAERPERPRSPRAKPGREKGKPPKHARSNGATAPQDAKLDPHDLYVGHSLALLQSAAWRVSSDTDRRILDRVELEHLRHHRKDNGRLPCTYGDFENAGVRRNDIRLSLARLVALGLLEVMRHGFPVKGEEDPVPNLYRLTYVKSVGDDPPETFEWERFKTVEQAQAAVAEAEARLEQEREQRRARRRARAAKG